ncbi:MAG: stage II sporulation protein R [Defluviitaleaceae bacterium]|nr:stage II sporulation protein R [Defluviitaleaceae bacterium]
MYKLRILKETKILAISLAIGLALAISAAAYTYVYSATTQRDIAENVIRFHVLAHSDEYVDQVIKDIVRKEVLAEFEYLLNSTSNVKESRQLLQAELPSIQAHAQAVVHKLGFDYQVNARIDKTFFPTQVYGELSFPPGVYEALQISIGDGIGRNWWCLMFPPLCFVDMTGTETGRQQLADTVSDESFRLLTHQEQDANPTMEVRFRIVEWWQNRRNTNHPTSPHPGQIMSR